MSNPGIRLVHYKDIDFQKWDQCIENSPFGIVYACSWFLDRICSRWDALIWGDYLYVMPLVNNRKFGISYIYQPFFSQQLGIFSNFPPEPEIVNQFLRAIPKKFRLTDMNLNLGNTPTTTHFRLKPNTTYLLPLDASAAQLRRGYHPNTLRNIRKAALNKVYISQVYDISLFLEFTRSNLKCKSPEIRSRHYAALHKVISHALYNRHGEIYGAWDSANNLIAAAFFLNSNRGSIYLAASSNPKGTKDSAMFLLIDNYIQNHAGKNMVLDFEGSNIPGLSRFYSGFGATAQIYYSVHQNHLPKILRYFKK